MRHLLGLKAALLLLTTIPAAGEDLGGLCVPDASRLCFQSGRFSATMTYQNAGSPLPATAVQPAGGAPGFFRFAEPAAAEIWLGLLDGCVINNRYWVSVLGVSSDGWALSVTDHATGALRSYSVPTGSYGSPISDVEAFDCPIASSEPEAPADPLLATTMDLGGGRFRVSAILTSPAIAGQTLQLTRNSGLFSFFAPSTPNVLVKIFYPGNTGFFGVAGSWNSTAGVIEVEDLCTGAMQSYNLASSSTFGDPDAFSANDAVCGLFANGFESGNLSAWSLSVP